jgi:hypothetical protein
LCEKEHFLKKKHSIGKSESVTATDIDAPDAFVVATNDGNAHQSAAGEE